VRPGSCGVWPMCCIHITGLLVLYRRSHLRTTHSRITHALPTRVGLAAARPNLQSVDEEMVVGPETLQLYEKRTASAEKTDAPAEGMLPHPSAPAWWYVTAYLQAEDEWWREHRDAKELFIDEFARTWNG
jgi:hypothetical protein